MPHIKPTHFYATKHSDYYVWKDTSERVARRCDDTVDKKRVNYCVLKHLFFWGNHNFERLGPTYDFRPLKLALLGLGHWEPSKFRKTKMNLSENVPKHPFSIPPDTIHHLRSPIGGSWATKSIAKNPRKGSFRRATNVTFWKFTPRPITKKPRGFLTCFVQF